MNSTLDKVFVDVRKAFRLLNSYQTRILGLVDYIRSQAEFPDMWGGRGWYAQPFSKRKDSPDTGYANLNVRKDMWGWDFLYNHFFEYYFGTRKQKRATIEMSVIQVSDDGFFLSNDPNKAMTNSASFASPESSNSWLVLMAEVYTKSSYIWLRDSENPDKASENVLSSFLSSPNRFFVNQVDNNCFLMAKYEMQCFASQSGADKVLREFGEKMKSLTNVEIFRTEIFSDSNCMDK